MIALYKGSEDFKLDKLCFNNINLKNTQRLRASTMPLKTLGV